MKPIMTNMNNRIASSIFMVAAMLLTVATPAADFACSGPQMGELYIDTKSGNITKGAEETQKVEIATENTNYRFEFKGKKNQFKALINRANGQIEMDDACTPECWGGPIFGTCTVVKAKF